MVSDIDCETCPSQYYNASNSYTAEELSDSDYSSPSSYGNYNFISQGWTDRVCPSKTSVDSCVPDMPIYSVSNWVGNVSFPFDGVLGLGPPSSTNPPSLIQKLYEIGEISLPVISLQIVDSDDSNAQFGYIDESSYSGNIKTHDSNQNLQDWWSLQLTGITYGDTDIKSSYSKHAILDSSTRFLHLPGADYQNFIT